MYGKPSQKPKEQPNLKSHIRKGDMVLVRTGKDRGKKGKVLRVDTKKGKAVVERINFFKRHTRPNPQKNIQGGILEREAPIRLDNLQLICPSCSQPSRTGSHRSAEGDATRFCKKCDTEVES